MVVNLCDCVQKYPIYLMFNCIQFNCIQFILGSKPLISMKYILKRSQSFVTHIFEHEMYYKELHIILLLPSNEFKYHILRTPFKIAMRGSFEWFLPGFMKAWCHIWYHVKLNNTMSGPALSSVLRCDISSIITKCTKARQGIFLSVMDATESTTSKTY